MKIHKEKSRTKTECGITLRTKAPFPYTHYIYNINIETSESGAKVDCLKCIKKLNKIKNHKS